MPFIFIKNDLSTPFQAHDLLKCGDTVQQNLPSDLFLLQFSIRFITSMLKREICDG